jgi:hypothetical protein
MTLKSIKHPSAEHSGLPLDSKRPPAREMSDTELLLNGIVAKYVCTQADEANEQHEAFLQLEEIRMEWKHRFPELPLSGTFDQD